MPINPPQPQFNSLSTIDFKGIAAVETKHQQADKVAFVCNDEPTPSAPKFGERPCAVFGSCPDDSLGAEDGQDGQAAAGRRRGNWRDYQPSVLQDDPWAENHAVAAAPKAKAPAKPAPAKAKSGAAPPPPSKKK